MKNVATNWLLSAVAASTLVTACSAVDNDAPVVVLTSPPAFSMVNGEVTLRAEAADQNLSRVDFFLDGSLLGTGTPIDAGDVSPYEFIWDSSAVGDGNHNVLAIAVDKAGNVSQSESVRFTVENVDEVLPEVVITTPGTFNNVVDTVSVHVDASDDQAVAYVELYVDGELLATDDAAPFSFDWDTTAKRDGSRTLLARAYDTSGNVKSSDLVTVIVANIDVTRPVVHITKPASHSRYTADQQAHILFEATDDREIARVELLVNGAVVSELNGQQLQSMEAEFFLPMAGLVPNSYNITVKAYDEHGNSGLAQITVFRD